MVQEALLTVPEVADRLRTTRETVRRWLRQGRLQGRRLGGTRRGYRIRAGEVERFLAPSREGSAAREDVMARAAAFMQVTARDVAANGTAAGILLGVCRAMAHVLQADCVFVAFLQGDLLSPAPVCYCQPPHRCLPAGRPTLTLGAFPCLREALEQRRPVFVGERPGDPEREAILLAQFPFRPRVTLAVPLMAGDEVLAVLLCAWKEPLEEVQKKAAGGPVGRSPPR